MNVEEFREYCLSLPYVTEDMAFGEEYLLFRVCGKIFACMGMDGRGYFVVKCDPDYAIELRDRYNGIVPAWHWNKKYWNQILMDTDVSDNMVCSLVRHSYSEVVKKLTVKVRKEFPEITEIY